MKKSTCFIIGLFLCTTCFSQNPVYKKFTMDDGLPGNEIYQITQDAKGYIWLATNKGASRFDGTRFENFTMEDGLPDNEVLYIIPDNRNRIWFKSFTGPMSYYDGTVHNSSNTPFLKKMEFKRYPTVFSPLYNGDILICYREKKILLLKDTSLSVYDTIVCTDIVQQKDSSILLFGFHLFADNGKRLNTNLYTNPKKPFTNYYSRQQDVFLMINDSDVFCWHSHRLTQLKNQHLISTRKGGVLVSDCEGYFWVTDHSKTYRFKVDSTFSEITDIHQYFDGIVVNNIFQDRDNNIWLATRGEGLLMVPALNIRVFDKNSGLEDNNITTALRVGDNIVCGTVNGYLHTINAHDKIERPEYLNDNEVRKIIKDEGNSFFILTQNSLFHHDAKKAKLLCTYMASYKSITTDSKGGIIAGGYNRILHYYQGKMNVQYFGIGDVRFYSVCERVSGELWGGTEKGLFILKGDSAISFHAELKPFSGWIDDISKTREGKMLVTTRDSGLAVITGDKIDFINSNDGLQSNSCTALFYDSVSGLIFLGLKNGLSIIKFDKNNKPEIKNYSATSGLLCSSIFSISESNGEILLGTDKGLLVFNQQELSTQVESPKVYITKLEINNVNTELKSNYELGYQSNDIRIMYAGISFRDPKSLEYRYQMTPIDTGWNITKSRTVIYADLAPGSYTFAVQVRSGSGGWCDAHSSFSVHIKEPYWTTWWFRALIILLGTALVYGVYRYQLNKKLEQHLAIAMDRARISSEMHDDLGSGLSKISLLSDMINHNTSEDDMKPHLENISRSSKEMVEKMGEIIWSMNVKNDQLANLIAYTRKYAMEFFESTSVDCIVVLPDTIPVIEIDGKIRRTIFLAIKEGLHNVLKHSDANKVNLKFEILTNSCLIIIQDNGRGIDHLKMSAFGNGLSNMKRRMGEIGGEFTIENRDGTIIELTIPLRY